jgi:hypothetical protein
MATKVVHVSDLSGREADEHQLGRLVVLEHPDIAEPAQLEVLPDEVANLQSAERLVRLEYYAPGSRKPETFTIPADQFNTLAKADDMRAILVRAITTAHQQRGQTAAATRTKSRVARGKVNYASLEHAGEPHRGRITDAEKQLVREHLDEINERLARDGLRTIDPSDPAMRERYGLGG